MLGFFLEVFSLLLVAAPPPPVMRYLWALAKIGATLIALAAVAAVAGYITIQVVTGKESVEVPDLTGIEMSEALRQLDEVGLRLQLEEEDPSGFDDVVPAGHVLRQHPAAGSYLKRDRKVRAVLSLGPRDVYVPRVVGEDVTTAQRRLQDAGLKLGDIVYVDHPLVPENVVVDQEPSRVSTGSDGRINLLVSSGGGDDAFVMPDLLGARAALVGAVLERRGFRLLTETEPYDGIPPGTIVRQKPLAGSQIRAGGTIWVWASRPTR